MTVAHAIILVQLNGSGRPIACEPRTRELPEAKVTHKRIFAFCNLTDERLHENKGSDPAGGRIVCGGEDDTNRSG